jgi:hypothetical protein
VFFNVKISGEPPPDVDWTFKKKNAEDLSGVRVENSPNVSKFFHDEPKRAHSGTYTITAYNKHGQDTADVEITVICELTSRTIKFFFLKHKNSVFM